MYMMTGNPILANQIRELRERGVSGRKGAWDTPLSLRESSEDHRDMLDMLKRRDADGLAAVIYRHLNRWRSHPVRKDRDRFPEQGAPRAPTEKRASR
jgi:DNA-binding GntR family transcriptional regulator